MELERYGRREQNQETASSSGRAGVASILHRFRGNAMHVQPTRWQGSKGHLLDYERGDVVPGYWAAAVPPQS